MKREGPRLASLVSLTEAGWGGGSLLRRRDELSGCAGETPSGAGLSRTVGRVSGGCPQHPTGWGSSLALYPPRPQTFFFPSSFCFGGEGSSNYVVNDTLNRKRNRTCFKSLFVLASDSSNLFAMLARLRDSKRVVGTSLAVDWCLHAETYFHGSVRQRLP